MSATPPPSRRLARFNGWSYTGLGVLAFGLVAYLAIDWQWLYSPNVALRYRVLYWGLLAFLLLIGASHFAAAHLLRNKVLVEAGPESLVLRGFDGVPTVKLLDKARALRVAPQMAGTTGLAYLLYVQGGWYIAVASAADAVKRYKTGSSAGEA